MRSTRTIARGIAVLGLLAMVGCGNKVSYERWQDRVAEYVEFEGNGDVNALRDITLPNSDRKGFAALGDRWPDKSTDVNGLLLGHREIGGRSWYFYLAGQVKNLTVREIRLAALSAEAGELRWEIGQGSDEAFAAYIDQKRKAWSQRFPNAAGEPYLTVPAWNFPGPDDVFQLTVDGNRVAATHAASGAQWTLTLPAPEQAARDQR